MGCHNTKSIKTRPDFYYQTSYLNNQYFDLIKKLKLNRERIYETIEKGYLLQNLDISIFQDEQIIRDTMSLLQQSKESHDYYIIQTQFDIYEKTQKQIQHDLSEIVEQHKLLLKKIDVKQPLNVEKMLQKMQINRDKLLSYYRIIYSPQNIDEKASSYQNLPSYRAYSTRDDM
ncbi:hypothetical protein ABPG74_006390 [Tetrahymena malaccensis]